MNAKVEGGPDGPGRSIPGDHTEGVRRAAWLAGLLAGSAALFTLNDPGITVDEPLDVAPGRKYVQILVKEGLGFLRPGTVAEVFADNAEHPPLGRWLLGIASTVGEPVELVWLGKDPIGLYVRSGRAAPALAFGLLVALVALEAGRMSGLSAAIATGFVMATMPRVFGHAHIAALDMFVALTWTAGLLAARRAADSPRPVRALALAGTIWGLALLTKLHGWLLIPAVAGYLALRLSPRRALPGLIAWGASGLVVFFVGWPWLWYDPVGRLFGYLNTAVDRTTILVRYFGTTYDDTQVPWHYPWLYFVATVPVTFHLLGLYGLKVAFDRRANDRFPLVLAAVVLGWLVLFSTTVAVYDGERLYLAAFPPWAILAGLGFSGAWKAARWTRAGRLALVFGTACGGYGIVALHPCELSYYNGFVGGLPGAERLGLELTYWTDSLTPELLAELAKAAEPGDPVALVPTLAPGQGAAATTRALARRSMYLADQEAIDSASWVVVHRREAYWPPGPLRAILARPPLTSVSRQGVWLSGVWRRPSRENPDPD